MPHRLPEHPGRLHGHVGTAALGQPVAEAQQLLRRGPEGPHLLLDLLALDHPRTGHHRVLMHVQPCTAKVHNVHLAPFPGEAGMGSPIARTLRLVLPDQRSMATIRDARRIPGPTRTRASRTNPFPTSGPAPLLLTHSTRTAAPFHASKIAHGAAPTRTKLPSERRGGGAPFPPGGEGRGAGGCGPPLPPGGGGGGGGGWGGAIR